MKEEVIVGRSRKGRKGGIYGPRGLAYLQVQGWRAEQGLERFRTRPRAATAPPPGEFLGVRAEPALQLLIEGTTQHKVR